MLSHYYNQIFVGQKMVARLTGFFCSLIKFRLQHSRFFSQNHFLKVRSAAVLQLSSLTVHAFLTAQIKYSFAVYLVLF